MRFFVDNNTFSDSIDSSNNPQCQEFKENIFIDNAVNDLKSLTKGCFVDSLLEVLKDDSLCLHKRYNIAIEISNVKHDACFYEYGDEAFYYRLKQAVQDPGTELYCELNYQRGMLPITIFGSHSLFSFNYSRTLQKVHESLDADLEYKISLA